MQSISPNLPLFAPNVSHFAQIYPNLPQFAQIFPNLSQLTPISANMRHYAPICPKLPQFAPISPNMPQFFKTMDGLKSINFVKWCNFEQLENHYFLLSYIKGENYRISQWHSLALKRSRKFFNPEM